MKITLSLILINTLIFFFTLANLEYFILTYGFNVKNFLEGNHSILITSIFLHADFLHLASNMVALFFLGLTIERNVKAWQYLTVYFLSGIAGNFSLFFPFFGYSPQSIAIGASAAIAGLVGLGTFICPGKLVFFPSFFPLPFVLAGAIYFLITLSELFAVSYIAYPAHLFGLVGGAIFGLAWGRNRIKRLSIFILLLLLISGLPLMIGYLL